MAGLARHSEKEIECPFCKKGKIRMHYQEGYLQAQTSRISGQTKQTFHRVGEKHIVQNGCSVCKKTSKEIEKALDTGMIREVSHKERLKRLKDAGLPTRIEE